MIFDVPQYIYETAPPKVREFWTLYKKAIGHTNKTVNIGQCIAVLRILVHNPEMYDAGFKTNVIELESVIFGYEGDEPIYSLFMEANQAIQRAIYLRTLPKNV